MTSDITWCVDEISSALRTLSALFEDPSGLEFADIRRDMERLEEQFKKKASIDAAFAFIADRDDAGRIVGANCPNANLQQCLDLASLPTSCSPSCAASTSDVELAMRHRDSLEPLREIPKTTGFWQPRDVTTR